MASKKGNYKVDGEIFETKEALTQRVRGIRDKYIGGKIVDPGDADFVKRLLENHEEATKKFGNGIKHFTVDKNKEGTDSFYITYLDETRDDFSFVHCIKQISRS